MTYRNSLHLSQPRLNISFLFCFNEHRPLANIESVFQLNSLAINSLPTSFLTLLVKVPLVPNDRHPSDSQSVILKLPFYHQMGLTCRKDLTASPTESKSRLFPLFIFHWPFLLSFNNLRCKFYQHVDPGGKRTASLPALAEYHQDTALPILLQLYAQEPLRWRDSTLVTGPAPWEVADNSAKFT